MSAAGRLAQFAPTVPLLYAGAVITTNGITATSNDSGRLYNMALATAPVLNLPAVSTIPDGYSVVIRATGLPTGFQTAYVAAEASKNITYRNSAANRFYLIGNGEVFRFTWLAGLDVWLAECLAQPASVTLRRHWSGTGGWNSSPTSFSLLFFQIGNDSYDTAVFNRSSGSQTQLPVSGLWRHYYRWQPAASAGGGATGSASISSCQDNGNVNTDYDYKYATLYVGEDTQFQAVNWTKYSPQGSWSCAYYSASTTAIWYYPDNNFGIITLVSR